MQGSTFYNDDTPIALKNNSGRNLFQNNTFADSDFGLRWDAVKASLTDATGGLETGGIVFLDPSTGRGNVIRRNTFHDYFDAVTTCPLGDPGVSNETDMYNNDIYNVSDDGISADGTCTNVRITGNRLHDVHTGVSMAPILKGPIYAIRNVIHGLNTSSTGDLGVGFKFNSTGFGTSGQMYLFHNTVSTERSATPGFMLVGEGTWQLIHSLNNIFSGTDTYAFLNLNPSQALATDHDDLCGTGANFAKVGNTPYADLPTFAQATGLKTHGVNAAPGFNNDDTLTGSSPLIDRGVVIPGVDDTSFAGAAPDPGAYESGATPGRLAVTTPLAFTPASPAVNASVTATYTVTNLGDSPVSVQYLMVGVRDPSGGNADIGVTSPLTIQPGQSYTFSMSRTFTSAGTYTAWPASFDGTAWNHLAGTSAITVH